MVWGCMCVCAVGNLVKTDRILNAETSYQMFQHSKFYRVNKFGFQHDNNLKCTYIHGKTYNGTISVMDWPPKEQKAANAQRVLNVFLEAWQNIKK